MRLSSRFILDNLFLLAVGVLALADLTAHEATTEKVVHQLVVHDGTSAEQRTAA